MTDGRELPLAAGVCGFDRAWMGEEHEELIAGTADLGLEGLGQIAAAWFGENGPELPIQAPALGGQCRGSQIGDVLGQGEHGGQPSCRRQGTGSSLASTA